MLKTIIRFNKQLIILGILILAFLLRLNQYTQFPIGGETQDESAWAYLGASIFQTGQPTSWSFFDAYKPKYIFQLRPNQAPLVRPDLDHPPLFSLIPGIPHALKNDWQTFPSLKLTRLPMIFLGTLNVALLILVATQYFRKPRWVYLAGLIYATAPSFVLASRLIVAENLLITWTLLSLFLLSQKQLARKYFWLIILGILAIMTKVSGLVIPASILTYGLMTQDKKVTWSGCLGILLGCLALFIYGASYNLELFLSIYVGQAGRDLGWSTLQNRLFLHSSIVEQVFFDGWIYLGLLASFISIYLHKPKYLAVNIFIILNLMFILITSGEQTFHAWYDYVLYPLMVFNILNLIKHIFKTQHWLLFGGFWLMILPIFRLAAIHGDWYSSVSNFNIRAISVIGFGPLGLSFLPKFWSKKASLLAAVLIFLVILAGVYAIINFRQTAYWEEGLFFSSK